MDMFPERKALEPGVWVWACSGWLRCWVVLMIWMALVLMLLRVRARCRRGRLSLCVVGVGQRRLVEAARLEC